MAFSSTYTNNLGTGSSKPYRFAPQGHGARHPPPRPSPLAPIRDGSESSLSTKEPEKLSLNGFSSYLKRYDTAFIVNDATSATACWDEVKRALFEISKVALDYSRDGVEIHFVNNTKRDPPFEDAESIEEALQDVTPRGPSRIGRKLKALLNEYIGGFEDGTREKRVNIIVITHASSVDEIDETIIEACDRLDDGEFNKTMLGIQFVQIGKTESVTESLKALDDLHRNLDDRKIRDIVDTAIFPGPDEPLTPERLCKILLGGIHREIDEMDV